MKTTNYSYSIFFQVIEEALRCLSNIYFQSSCAQNYGVENATIPAVIEQVGQMH